MKRGRKIAIVIIVLLIFLYTLCFLSYAIMDGCTWLTAWVSLQTLGIALGISALVFIVSFLVYKWLEE